MPLSYEDLEAQARELASARLACGEAD